MTKTSSTAKDFVRSFLLPTGGTEKPTKGNPLYAGRYGGHCALFAFGSYNLLLIERHRATIDPTRVWVDWMTPSIADPSVKRYVRVIEGELEALGYRVMGTESVPGQTWTFHVWVRTYDTGEK